MAKDGKFANVNNGDVDVEKAVNGAAISAVTKALDDSHHSNKKNY
ncbi:Variable outer membrane protein (plasmid) [Borrelia hermsii YBT]|uniref:Variable large protein n=1 Tax=Borrelia hermsii YBT TaxID=1313295 RepID=W5T7I4_BORHE|nr:Variable outer membrane protein [Borrelia hermsii YBT]